MTDTSNPSADIAVDALAAGEKTWPAPNKAALAYLENNFFETKRLLTELVEEFDNQTVEYPREKLSAYLAMKHRADLSDKKYKDETKRFDDVIAPAMGAISVWLTEAISIKRELTLGPVQVFFHAIKGDEIVFIVAVPMYVPAVVALSAEKVSMFNSAVAQQTEWSKSLLGWASAGFVLNATMSFSQKDIVSCVQSTATTASHAGTMTCTTSSAATTMSATSISQCCIFSAMVLFLLCVFACLNAFAASGTALGNMVHNSPHRPNPAEKKLRWVQYAQIGTICAGAAFTLVAISLKLFFKL